MENIKNPETLEKLYNDILPQLKEAEQQLNIILENVIASIQDCKLVRAQKRGIRIKSLDSVKRKVEANGWQPQDALYQITDLVGARVVCNNIQDIYRFQQLLSETFFDSEEKPVVQDYLKKLKSTGYRGLHVNLGLRVGQPFPTTLIPCEVQIRILLQDCWAELVHDDIYKEGSGLPEDLHGRCQDLANILTSADEIAERIRGRVSQEATPIDKRINFDKINRDGLVYIFSDIFGRFPSEYIVQSAMNVIENVGLSSLKDLQAILKDTDFREKIDNAYRTQTGNRISNEDIFLVVPIAIVHGVDQGIKAARKRGKEYTKELENYWRNEVLSELPETIDEFIENIQFEETSILQIAKVLGGAKECAICGDDIIDAEQFEEAVYEHYDIDENDGRITSALFDSGIPLVDDNDPHFCSYHAHQMSKD